MNFGYCINDGFQFTLNAGAGWFVNAKKKRGIEAPLQAGDGEQKFVAADQEVDVCHGRVRKFMCDDGIERLYLGCGTEDFVGRKIVAGIPETGRTKETTIVKEIFQRSSLELV